MMNTKELIQELVGLCVEKGVYFHYEVDTNVIYIFTYGSKLKQLDLFVPLSCEQGELIKSLNEVIEQVREL